jgi:ankyrin repeat protein
MDLSKQAYELCWDKNAPELKSFLDTHPDVDIYLAQEKDEDNIMGVAASNETAECLQVLVDFKADVNRADEDGGTALMAAANYGSTECVRLLLEKRADITLADGDGNVALHFTAMYGKHGCMQLLLDANADVQHPDNSCTVAIHWACEDGRAECVRLLIDSGADVNATNVDGKTGLMLAAQCQEESTECLQLMIDAKADVDRKDADGCTALHNACEKAAFVLLTVGAATDSFAVDTDAKSSLDPAKLSLFKHGHAFIDEYQASLKRVLSQVQGASVETCTGRSGHGLYAAPLEQVLGYLGLSVTADQIVNATIDGEGVRRTLIPSAVGAAYWLEQLPPVM